MNPAEIKYRLAIAEPTPYSQTDIAAECGVTNATVFDVIHGNRRSERVASRIAKILKSTPAALWPQLYGPNARRRRRASFKSSVTTLAAASAG